MHRKLFFLFMLLSSVYLSASEYLMQDIQLTAAQSSLPLCCNDNGEVAGYIQMTLGDPRSIFYWSPSAGLKLLDEIPQENSLAIVKCMNSKGAILGVFKSYDKLDSGFQWVLHPYLWDISHGFRDLGTVRKGKDTKCLGMDDEGNVLVVDEQNSIYLWKEGRFDLISDIKDLMIFKGVPVIAMNNNGLIAFTRRVAESNLCQIVLYDYSSGEEKILLESDKLVPLFLRMNDFGDIIGKTTNDGFLLENNGKLTFFDHFQPWDINNSKEIVGTILTPQNSKSGRYKEGKIVEFDQLISEKEHPFPFSEIREVWTLNNKGQCFGNCFSGMKTVSFRLVPSVDD